ncbi:MAG TPA: lytic transglycosylase domain-containing protein [Thermoanaerobaculia bacterium]|nr:lytic transglycosylase domain-containing protein [Thermoanaerobaculia bacterium]
MSARTRMLAIVAGAVVLAGCLAWLAVRSRPAAGDGGVSARALDVTELRPAPSLATLPPERWTPRLLEFHAAAEWDRLRSELEALRAARPDEFDGARLGYLLARAAIELGDFEAAERELAPFLAPDDPFAPLARRRSIAIALARGEEAEAARLRESWIFDQPDSMGRNDEIEAQIDFLQRSDSPGLLRLAQRLDPPASSALGRELQARSAEALWELERRSEAVAQAVRVLRGGTADDPAERAFRLLDRSGALARATPDVLVLAGETARAHRHFARAVEILEQARERLPSREADLLFSIGRSWFGSESYEPAEQAYLLGAARAPSDEQRALFHFHASRAAQLLGEDDRAVRHMTRAIAVPGRFASTSAALTQRMRTRIHEGDLEGGVSDLRQLEWLFPRGESRAEASTQLAISLLAAGRAGDALRELERIPSSLVGAWERPEIDYWRARALEASHPERALEFHLRVMRAELPTHFAYFSRERTRSLALGPVRASRLVGAREEADAAAARGDWEGAREPASVALLLDGTEDDRSRLERIYRELPSYREVLDLEPAPLPAFPLDGAGEGDAPARADLLMAMGLFDEAQEQIESRWGLESMSAAFTRAHALNLAAASRESIHAIEVMMRRVPRDFVPQLLPRRVRELLYPRYFHGLIMTHAARYEADPRLVLAIMREESRFNPRAKSPAAARGLLQFIITTARDIGTSLGLAEVESEDLYDARLIIQLGAKYIGDLLDEFDGDAYRAAAAYNAGPHQTRLWARLQPAPGSDYFLSSINFSETKHYVRKVLNSHERYGEIYEGDPPVGGLRAEP